MCFCRETERLREQVKQLEEKRLLLAREFDRYAALTFQTNYVESRVWREAAKKVRQG